MGADLVTIAGAFGAVMMAMAAVQPGLAIAVDAGRPGEIVTPFRTEVTPRIDPVFGGVAALRAAVDDFLALESDMKKTRDGFSRAVNETLVELRPTVGDKAGACPPGALAAHARAREAGRRFLALGRRFEGRYREVRRGSQLGDTVALTPDYRWKVSRARELYGELLLHYQEMRAAFHQQLGAELLHAGCKVTGRRPGQNAVGEASGLAGAPDPENLDDWALTAPDAPLPPVVNAAPPRAPIATGTQDPDTAPAIWIEIDNSRCARPSSLTLDGRPITAIAAGKKVEVRTRAGPHAVCVLPETDKRRCGASGTVRRVYLYEGWSMAVRCAK